MNTKDCSDTESALCAGQMLSQPRVVAGFKPYAIIANGSKIVELTPEPEQPPRIKAKPELHDAPSLIAYVNRFKSLDTAIFADVDANKVVAILDHHSGDTGAEYCDHRAIYTARHSEEWKTWNEHSGVEMNQQDFARFIEDNAQDVLQPSGAELLEIALSIEASKSGTFKSARRLDNGSVEFHFSEETTGVAGGGSLQIPKEFSVQVRPFLGCSAHRLTARLRYRINGGSLALWYDLKAADVLRREAFDAILKRIENETQQGVMLGVPSP